MNIGIGLELTLAFAIGVINQWEPKVTGGRLSWICVLILMHPVIFPGPPLKTLVASIAAASMDPVGLLIAKARGLTLPPTDLLAWIFPAETSLQMILMHVRADPVPPSVRLGAPIPGLLERVILACLAKNPADRPLSALDLTQAFADSGGGVWTQEEARRWWDASLGAAGTISAPLSEPGRLGAGIAI